jgi:hypothetical protein
VYFSLLYIPETKTISYIQNHCTIHLPNILIISTSEDGGSAFLQNTGKSMPLPQGIKTGKKKSKQVKSFDERKCYG